MNTVLKQTQIYTYKSALQPSMSLSKIQNRDVIFCAVQPQAGAAELDPSEKMLILKCGCQQKVFMCSLAVPHLFFNAQRSWTTGLQSSTGCLSNVTEG